METITGWFVLELSLSVPSAALLPFISLSLFIPQFFFFLIFFLFAGTGHLVHISILSGDGTLVILLNKKVPTFFL